MKRAFTLIELLVVIAIIAILAAILFPVFAQAKAAAKTAASISNVKQLSLGYLMYSADYDDMMVLAVRQDYAPSGPVTNEYSWKQLIAPYVKNQDMYKDSVNPAAKFRDVHSDPATRAFNNWTPVNVESNLVFNRGYMRANIFVGGFVDYKAVSQTSIPDVAKVMNIVEGKILNSIIGPYLPWIDNVDADTSWMGAANPTTGLRWNWGGEKWGNKAMAVGFHDGHAKRLSFSAICGASFMKMAPTATGVDHWGLSASEQAGWSWADTMCTTLPNQFK
jgi:prepilin-type N-terminal cleavage/methylation domain-containing protein